MAAAKRTSTRRPKAYDSFWDDAYDELKREEQMLASRERKIVRPKKGLLKTSVAKSTGKSTTGKPASKGVRVPRSSGPASMKNNAGSLQKPASRRTKVNTVAAGKAGRAARPDLIPKPRASRVSSPRMGGVRGNAGNIGSVFGRAPGGGPKRHGR